MKKKILFLIICFVGLSVLLSCSLYAEEGSLMDWAKKGIERAPDNPMSWDLLGTAYMEAKDLHKAIESYEKAVGLDKNYYMSYARLGWAYKEVGMKDKAKENFKKAILILNEQIKEIKATIETFDGFERENFEKSIALRFTEAWKRGCERGLAELK